jgi:hypothetical protein
MSDAARIISEFVLSAILSAIVPRIKGLFEYFAKQDASYISYASRRATPI